MPRRYSRSSSSHNQNQISFISSLKAVATTQFHIATCINFVIMIIYYLIFVTGPEYIQTAYNVSLSLAGFTSGVMVLGCLAGRFICGNLGNLLGFKCMLILGLAINATSILSFFVVGTLPQIFVERFFIGIGVGFAGNITAIVVAHSIPNNMKAFGISIFSLSTALALAFGPFLGIIMSQNLSYSSIIKIIGTISILLIFIGFILKVDMYGKTRKRNLLNINNYIDPRVVKFGITPFLVFLGYGCMQAFLASYAKQSGIEDTAGLFFIIYALIAIITRPFIGRQMDARGENTVIYPLLGIISFGLIMLAIAHSSWIMIVAAIFLGFGYGNFQSICQAVAVILVTPTRYAQATSTFFIFMDLGIGIGPYIFGLFIPLYGYEGMFLALSLIVVFSILPYHVLHGRKSVECSTLNK